ncbi:uncharacterized protein BXZ73DRAFT_27338, partial [Epithele typhae]|uniref:uncharacterized protein n=1 Tax=Epithele typhae TaxID=378194 RepID=UPI002007562C
VEFHVWKGILVEASPVFGDMTAFDGTTADGAVTLTETSAALEPFLRMCYPPPHGPPISQLGVLLSVIALAHKYQADGVLQTLKNLLVKKFSPAEPLRVYAIAVRLEMTDVMEAAARDFLAIPSFGPYTEELEGLSAGVYHRLLTYRSKCNDTLEEMIQSNLAWLPPGPWMTISCDNKNCAKSSVTCRIKRNVSFFESRINPDRPVPVDPSVWFWNHHNRMAKLLKDRPCSAALSSANLLERGIVEASSCISCREKAPETLRLFNDRLRAEVDRRIHEVSLS